MLSLEVFRTDGSLVDENSELYYDETVEVRAKAQKECDAHLCVTIGGVLADRGPYSTAIYDLGLAKANEWREKVHIRHPRSPLQQPWLEIVVRSSEQAKEREISSLGSRLTSKSEGSIMTPQSLATVRWKTGLQQAIELEMRSMRPALERVRVIAEINIVSVAPAVEVRSCTVRMDGGLVELMGSANLPVFLDAGGVYAQCYNLLVRAQASPTAIKALDITIECVVLSHSAKPLISTTWTPVVDFEGIQGPLPKTPAIHIPSHSPQFNGSQPNLVPPNNSSTTLDIVGTRRSSANLSLMNGLSIFITGPQFVSLGSTFVWRFVAMSRSQRERTFALSFGEHSTSPTRLQKPLTSRLDSFSRFDEDLLRAQMSTHYSATGSNTGIIPLVSGFSVGKLAPQGCFETDIKLKALKLGTHTIESSSIRDLATGDSYDIGSLLEVIVVP